MPHYNADILTKRNDLASVLYLSVAGYFFSWINGIV
jgi:hypothetical protein